MDKKQFESLDADEQVRVFHESTFKERVELLLCASQPQGLMRSMSPEELYLMTQEMAPEERVDVIVYASPPQLVFLSDLACWKKDEISPADFVEWLEMLLAADEDRLVEWLTETDYEMVIAAFKKIVHVLKPDREYPSDEILRDTPYFTLDEYYHIYVKEENLETVRRALECLYERQRGRYASILEGIMGELDAEIEEDAYQLRLKRLADRGFPDVETARRIYTPLNRDEFDRFPEKKPDSKNAGPRDGAAGLPDYPVLWTSDRIFLDDVFLTLASEEPAAEDALREELVWISNKLIACDGIDYASEERIHRGIERVRRFVSIGLELLADGDRGRAAQILKRKWVEAVFRFGYGRLEELRDRAMRLIDRFGRGDAASFGEFLDEPYDAVFGGLLRAVPELRDRDFKSLAEVREAEATVLEVDAVLRALEAGLPDLFKRGKNAPRATLFALLGTLFARSVAGDRLLPLPLTEKKFRLFLAKAFGGGNGSRTLVPEYAERFVETLVPPKQRESASGLFSRLFLRIESELGGVDPEERVDPRFITCVRFIPGKTRTRDR